MFSFWFVLFMAGCMQVAVDRLIRPRLLSQRCIVGLSSSHFSGWQLVGFRIEEFTFLETDFFRKKVVPALADQKIFLNMLYLREYIEFFHI